MTTIDVSLHDHQQPLLTGYPYPLIDTHTHFDAPIFDSDRMAQARQAYEVGIRHLILVGYVYRHFPRLYEVQRTIEQLTQPATLPLATQSPPYPDIHIALGLHPFYIEQHTDAHLSEMEQQIIERRPIAIGEIGLDTYTDVMKQPKIIAKQRCFFEAQLDMAVRHQLPVMLHIRKAHAEALALLKAHHYNAHELGGIAHSFSGGVQEAKAFVKLGFKLGVTGQVTNPNAKKLRRAIHAAVEHYGIECLVIETDCPDMTPISCQESANRQSGDQVALGHRSQGHHSEGHRSDNQSQYGENGYNRNVPANLTCVLGCLSEILDIDTAILAPKLWQNSCDALQMSWSYCTET